MHLFCLWLKKKKHSTHPRYLKIRATSTSRLSGRRQAHTEPGGGGEVTSKGKDMPEGKTKRHITCRGWSTTTVTVRRRWGSVGGRTMKLSCFWILRWNGKLIKHKKMSCDTSRLKRGSNQRCSGSVCQSHKQLLHRKGQKNPPLPCLHTNPGRRKLHLCPPMCGQDLN